MEPIIVNNFNGGVNLGVPNNGLLPNESPEMYNYLVSDSGLDSCPGSSFLNSKEVVSSSPILGLARFNDGTNWRTLAKCGRTIYDVAPIGAHTELATGLPDSADVNFEFWLGRYFFADGTDYWSGTTGAAIKVTQKDHNGNVITSKKATGDYILQHNERLWLLHKTNQTLTFSEKRYSAVDNFDRWHVDGNGNVDRVLDNFDKFDGHPLTAYIRYNDKLLVFKEHKVWFVVGDDSDNNLDASFTLNFGAFNQKSVVLCRDGFVRGIDAKGAWEYSDQTGFKRISRNIDNELKQIFSLNRGKVAVGYWDKYFLISYAYMSSINNRVMIGDVERRNANGYPCWMPRRGWNVSCFVVFEDDEILYAGSSTKGFVNRLFYGLTDNGVNVFPFWRSKRFQPLPGMECQLSRMQGVLGQGSQIILNVYNEKDIGYNMSVSYPTFGAFLADETNPDYEGFTLGDDNDPTAGDSLISDDDVGLSHSFESGVPGGKTFQQFYITISKTNEDFQRVESIEIYSIPVRQTG